MSGKSSMCLFGDRGLPFWGSAILWSLPTGTSPFSQSTTRAKKRAGVVCAAVCKLRARTPSSGPSLPSGKPGNCVWTSYEPAEPVSATPSTRWKAFSAPDFMDQLPFQSSEMFWLGLFALLNDRTISFCMIHQKSFSLGVKGIKFCCKA